VPKTASESHTSAQWKDPFAQLRSELPEAAGAALAWGMYPTPAATIPQITTARATKVNFDLRKFIHYLLEALE
jgi:hypothetical protein